MIRGMYWKEKFLLSTLGIGLILIFFLLIPVSVSNDLIFPAQSAKFFVFSFGILIVSAVFALSAFFGNQPKKIKITPIDIGLILFIVYTFSHLIFFEDVKFATQYWELTGLVILYVIIRNVNPNNYTFFFVTLLIAAIVQAIYGNLQLYGFFPSHHNLFKMTGSFFNPGPYAGYLVSGLPVAVCFYLFRNNLKSFHLADSKQHEQQKPQEPQTTNHKQETSLIHAVLYEYIPLIVIITVLLVLPASKSRAAWLGAIVAVGYLLFLRYSIKDLFQKYFNTRFKKAGVMLILMIMVAGGVSGVYYLKKDSADGRLFIWKITTRIIRDKPVSGHGYGQFAAHYMNYQADYFRQNRGSDEASIAGNNIYAFNEFLRISSETGIIGLFLSLAVLFCAICRKLREDISVSGRILIYTARAGIIAIIVFGCFSYPGEILPIKMNLVLFLAVIAKLQKPTIFLNKIRTKNNPPRRTSRNKRNFKKIIVILFIVLMYFPVRHLNKLYSANKEWRNAYILYQVAGYDACLNDYRKAYPQLRNDGDFLVNYGKALSMAGKHEKAIEILDEAQDYLSNTIVYTALGDSYKASKQYKLAEQAYRHAWYMIPSRFYPKYLLAKLYDETGQQVKAVAIAKELLNKEVKIESKAIEEIKEEMREIISQYQPGIKE